MIMKLKGFIITAVAAVAALAACQNKGDLDTSKFELSQTTLSFGTSAESKTVTLTSGKTWQAEFTAGVEWVSVTPKSGSGSASPQTITITVTPNDGYERSTTIKFKNGLVSQNLTVKQAGNNESVTTPTLDPTQTYTFRKADKIVSGQAYVMVATKNNKLWAAASPAEKDLTNGYGYPSPIEVVDANGTVEVVGSAAYVFTASESGFMIKNYGTNKYLSQADKYGSFTFSDAPTAGQYWSVEKNADGTFKVLNTTVSKWIVIQSGNYDSFGITNTETGGSMPWLYEYVGEGVAPEYKEMTIDQFYSTTDSYVTVKAQVVAVGAKTMVLNDGSDKNLYVFVDAAPGVNVGDVVKVDGLKSTYGKSDAGYTQLKQLKNVTITKITDDITAADLTALALTAEQIDAPYSNEATSLVTIEGTVVKDGNYINLELDGTVLGSVVESTLGSELPEGVRLSITGYYAGINTKGYFCILPTAYTYSNTPFFNIPTTNVEVTASETSAAITVKGNVDWTASCETAGFALDKTSGNGDATITVSFAANETEEAKTATVKVSTTAEVATQEFTVTITQKAPAAAGSLEMIDDVADLTAGKYLMAGYLTSYSSNTYEPYSYHIWTGATITGSGKTDLVTVQAKFADGLLEMKDAEQPAKMELVTVSGKPNTYLVKFGDKYLTSTSAENRKLSLGTTQTEWVASKCSKGGIVMTGAGVNVGTAGATKNMIRSYIDASSLSYGLVFFKQN